MKSLLLVTLCLALPLQALAQDLPQWRDVINNDKLVKSPTAAQVEKFASHAVRATGAPQMFTVGDRFVFLFDDNGYAVVTFDLTMDKIGIADMGLGAIGIGHWSLEGIYKLFRDMKEKPMNLVEGDAGNLNLAAVEGLEDLHDANITSVVPTSAKEVENGYKFFSKLEFNDSWIARNKAAKVADGERSGFAPASFTMGDLYVPAEKRAEAEKMWNRVSLALFREDLASMGGLENFTKQFGMDWDSKSEQFKMVWRPQLTGKKPNLPGWVINYTNPTDILAYKYTLRQIEQYTGYADMIFGVYGAIGATLVTRVVNSICNQFDSHENQMLAFFEGAAAGVYDLGMPLQDANEFIEGSSLLLYLNKLGGGDDLTNAEAKRMNILKEEAIAREANTQWMEKHGFELKMWADQREATVFKKGKRLGVVSLVLDPKFLTKWQSWHYYDAVPVAKAAGRLTRELAVDAIRYVLPSAINLSQWLPINFSIYIPGMFWDGLIRGRSFSEIAYEGHVLSQVNATLAGKWTIPGYTMDEVAKMRKALYGQRVNPFDTTVRKESKAMARNMRLIEAFVNAKVEKGVFQLRDSRLDQ